MAETHVYTTPQAAGPTITGVEVVGLEMYTRPVPNIHIVLMDQNGKTSDHYYREADGALGLILALNKANLAIKSLQRRILEKLLADGKLVVGTITGTPD